MIRTFSEIQSISYITKRKHQQRNATRTVKAAIPQYSNSLVVLVAVALRLTHWVTQSL